MADVESLRLGNWLNLLVAVLVFLIGLWFFFLSGFLRNKNFLKIVLGFWLGQWFVFAVIWGRIISIHPQKNDYWVLGFGDLQSMLAIGFSIAFLFGEEVKARIWGILRGLGKTYLLLIVINVLAVGALAGGSRSVSDLREFFLSQWVSTGSVLSLIAFCLLGLSFVLRLGRLGFFMLAACVFYATLQSPIYGALFGSSSEELPQVRLALAFGKALLGAIFYWLFLEPATSYGRMNIPLHPGPEFDWRALARRAGGPLVLAITIAVVVFRFSPDQTPASLTQTVLGLSTKLLSYSALLIWLYSLLAPRLVRTRFTVNGAIATERGDKIYLTGNCQELGDWWPGETRAIGMDGTNAPTWTVEVKVPAKREIQFKFVRLRADGLTWENDGQSNNHKETVDADDSKITREWRR